MKISGQESDSSIVEAIGNRLSRYRLNMNMSQEELAYEAGVSRPTVQRLEAGQSVQLSNFIKVLKALGLSKNIEALIPRPKLSPLQLLELEETARVRATGSRKIHETETEEGPWQWTE